VTDRGRTYGGWVVTAGAEGCGGGAYGWRVGAQGLLKWHRMGWTGLHNRRLGVDRHRGDLDHVAVAPGGVFVIDAKTLTAARVSVRTRGGLLTPARETLWVSGRDHSAFVVGSIVQQAAVRAALTVDDPVTGAGAVEVAGVLCFLDASIDGWRWRPLRVGGVHVLSPTGTARLLRRPGPLGPAERRVVWEHLAARLPPRLTRRQRPR